MQEPWGGQGGLLGSFVAPGAWHKWGEGAHLVGWCPSGDLHSPGSCRLDGGLSGWSRICGALRAGPPLGSHLAQPTSQGCWEEDGRQQHYVCRLELCEIKAGCLPTVPAALLPAFHKRAEDPPL